MNQRLVTDNVDAHIPSTSSSLSDAARLATSKIEPGSPLRDSAEARACPVCSSVGRPIVGKQHYCEGCRAVYYTTDRVQQRAFRPGTRDEKHKLIKGLMIIFVAGFVLFAISMNIQDGFISLKKNGAKIYDDSPIFWFLIAFYGLQAGLTGWLGWKVLAGKI